jgi:proteasome accessory factor B
VAPRISRLERITNLVLVLLETSRPLSLREIGTQVAGYPSQPDALRQAFERDKKTLRDGGIPVETLRIDGEEQAGYRILAEEYFLPELDLDEEEQAAIALALAAVRLEGAPTGELAAKLVGAAPDGGRIAPMAVLPSLPELGPLQLAIRERRVVGFTYHGRARSVSGHGLVFREGSWYLVGFDESVGEVRTFRVDRIEGALRLGEPGAYELPAPDVAPEVRRARVVEPEGADGAIEVTLDVDEVALAALTALTGGRAQGEEIEGAVRFRFPVADEESFLRWLAGLGDLAVLRAPERLVAAFVARLEEATG